MNKFKTFLLYLTIFVTGGVILIIEIGGTRLLAPFYGSTIFVWSSLITVTLGSLSLDYFIGGRIADRYPSAKVLYSILILGGFLTILFIKLNQSLLVFTDQFGLRFGPLVGAFVLFSLPLSIFSTMGPFLIRLRSMKIEKTGSVSGYVYGISTVGSLLGALLVGFYLIPNFSIVNILTVSAGLVISLSVIGLFLEKIDIRIAGSVILILLACLVLPSVSYKDKEHQIKIIHQEPSFYADLKILETPGGSICLVMDGAIQTCIYGDGSVPEAKYVREINRRLKESFPEDTSILLMGLGGGGLVKVLADDYEIDIVELDSDIVKLAKEFFKLELTSDDNIFIDDARTYLKNSDKKYDLIISDLYLGNTMPIYMYTQEAFELVKSRLTDRGVFINNVVGRIDGTDEMAPSIIKTLASVFPNVIITSNDPDKLDNILVHTSLDMNYHPEFKAYYRECDVDYSQAEVITDLKNPLDLLLAKSSGEFLAISKELAGYESLFSN